MLRRNGVQSSPTTVKNPQVNAIIERLHQSIGSMLAISCHENPPTNHEDMFHLVKSKCSAAQYAVRGTSHRHLHFSPGELSFGRNMLIPLSPQINWKDLISKRQSIIDKLNDKENVNRRHHDYKQGDKILILQKEIKGKLDPRALP